MLRYAIIVIFVSQCAYAQVNGGRRAFEMVNVPVNAHSAGLGRINVSVYDQDPTLFLNNPALLTSKYTNRVAFNYSPYLAQIKLGSTAGTFALSKLGTMGVAVQYIDYGKIDQRDAAGAYEGSFTANDFAITTGYSHTLDNFSVGASVKFLGSQIMSYSAYALAADFGATFKHPYRDFCVGMAIKNLGAFTKKYTKTSTDSLPLDVQLGVSYKLDHAPLRISLTGHQLTRWDILYNDPNQVAKLDENGQPIEKKIRNVDRMLRHLVIALEILPTQYFHLRAGYNFLMSRELSLSDGFSTAGIALGGTVRVKMLEAGYTYTIVHRAGGMHSFSVITNLSRNSFRRVAPNTPINN